MNLFVGLQVAQLGECFITAIISTLMNTYVSSFEVYSHPFYILHDMVSLQYVFWNVSICTDSAYDI
jgi:hypothetical protein